MWTNKSATGKDGPDVRGTHAALPGGGPNSHYVLAWMTTEDVTLQQFDLYPAPAAGAKLATRKHVVAPAGAAQSAGCVDGQPAAPSCVEILPASARPVIGYVGGRIQNFSFTAVYEPTANGAYFLGELTKFVHASPQRFSHVHVAGGGACGLSVGVRGSAGEEVHLAAVDPSGTTRLATATIPAGGATEVVM